MRAKKVYEQQNFERGQEPKKALGVGLDAERYVDSKLREKGFDPEKKRGDFWELFFEGFRDWGPQEMGEHVVQILDEGDPKKMMEYMDMELDNWFQMEEEFGDIQ